MNRYYIADLHLNHDNVRKMDGRKFLTLHEMNEYIIKVFNTRVKQNDEVVFIGDVLLSNNIEDAMNLIKRLNGKKYLIIGNHDRYIKNQKFDKSLFVWIKDYVEINDNKRRVILSHYPIMFYKGQYRGNNTYHLCGHVHDTTDNKLLEKFIMETRKTMVGDKTIPCNIINTFCKFSNYIPLTLDEWIEVTEKRLKERYS